ncbi:hypothetical protein GGR52DRAFT_177591 [Hypoxylon sp. FL1284]|nr:hypothetical protein GGR52DRAFT_177591 [Hypoxylon sp. FL1284]
MHLQMDMMVVICLFSSPIFYPSCCDTVTFFCIIVSVVSQLPRPHARNSHLFLHRHPSIPFPFSAFLLFFYYLLICVLFLFFPYFPANPPILLLDPFFLSSRYDSIGLVNKLRAYLSAYSPVSTVAAQRCQK